MGEQLEQEKRQVMKQASASLDVVDGLLEELQACDALKDEAAAKECHDALERKAAAGLEQANSRPCCWRS